MNRNVFAATWACGVLIAFGGALGLLAHSGLVEFPPPARSGAPTDGGLTCTACHAGTADSDPRGSLRLETGNYKPGVAQTLRLTLSHPDARRWGFQITARIVNDETRAAGTFRSSSEVMVICGPDGRRPPCNGAPEFASHVAATTYQGRPGPVTWEIEWVPPAEDVGDVIFYAAGNAANNDGTNRGDRIYTTSLRIENAGGCPLSPRRGAIRSVVNAASFSPAAIAPNAMITIFGVNFTELGVQRTAGRGDFREGKFPLTLACIGVEVGGRRAPVTFVKADQINAQAPTLDMRGPVEVRVILNPGYANEVRSDPATVTMQSVSPAFFLFGDGRSIAAQHADFKILADPNLIAGATPARPGEVVILYGTGFGLTEPVYQAGEVPDRVARLRESVTVSIGGTVLRPEDVLYAGLSPGSISGLYQFNVRVPETVPEGYVPVEIRVGGQSTQSGAAILVRR